MSEEVAILHNNRENIYTAGDTMLRMRNKTKLIMKEKMKGEQNDGEGQTKMRQMEWRGKHNGYSA